MDLPIGGPGPDVRFDFHRVFPFLENGCWLQPPMWICPLVVPALTFVLTFMDVFPFLAKLRLFAQPRFRLSGADIDIAGASASFDVRFNFHRCFPFLESSTIGGASPPALTLVLTFTVVFPFIENRC